jgi:hypothetical protein
MLEKRLYSVFTYVSGIFVVVVPDEQSAISISLSKSFSQWKHPSMIPWALI